MKRIATALLLGLFVASVVGCEASAKIGDNDTTHNSTYKKTTVTTPSGDTTIRTEKRVD